MSRHLNAQDAEFSDDVEEGAAGACSMTVIVASVIGAVAVVTTAVVLIVCCACKEEETKKNDGAASTTPANAAAPPPAGGDAAQPKTDGTDGPAKPETPAKPVVPVNKAARNWTVKLGLSPELKAATLDSSLLSTDLLADAYQGTGEAIEAASALFERFRVCRQKKQESCQPGPEGAKLQAYVERAHKHSKHNQRMYPELSYKGEEVKSYDSHSGDEDYSNWPAVQVYGRIVAHQILRSSKKPTVIMASNQGYHLAKSILTAYAHKTSNEQGWLHWKRKLSFVLLGAADEKFGIEQNNVCTNFHNGLTGAHKMSDVVARVVITSHDPKKEDTVEFAGECWNNWWVDVYGFRSSNSKTKETKENMKSLTMPIAQSFKNAGSPKVVESLKAQYQPEIVKAVVGENAQTVMQILQHWAAEAYRNENGSWQENAPFWKMMAMRAAIRESTPEGQATKAGLSFNGHEFHAEGSKDE